MIAHYLLHLLLLLLETSGDINHGEMQAASGALRSEKRRFMIALTISSVLSDWGKVQ